VDPYAPACVDTEPVGAGLLAKALRQRLHHRLTQPVRQQAGSYGRSTAPRFTHAATAVEALLLEFIHAATAVEALLLEFMHVATNVDPYAPACVDTEPVGAGLLAKASLHPPQQMADATASPARRLLRWMALADMPYRNLNCHL
jgi:hypothetical protein